MQTLAAYMLAHGITDGMLGERVGLSRSAVNRIRRGLSDPPASTLRRIVLACDGKVSFDAMLWPKPDNASKSEAVSV